MSNLKQDQLMTYIDAACTFYERVTEKLPTPRQTQQLLAIAGVHETLERIKRCGDDVRRLQAEEERDES